MGLGSRGERNSTIVARFVDTNILVYAEDLDAGSKRTVALNLIRDCWNQGDGVLSIQVLKEFYVTVTRKLPVVMSFELASTIVDEYLTWQIVPTDEALLRAGIGLSHSAELSLWDALVVQAAARAKCRTLYTEDLTHGQSFGSLEIINPFKE